MRPVEQLPAQSRVARPWRNGGGLTRDIVLFPQGSSDDRFLWRASLATIAAAGPFSAWPGVDRTILPLQGELFLSIDGAKRRLRPGDPAIEFAGEAAVAARPAADACTVLNLMARRGRIRAQLERWEATRPTMAGQILLVAEVATSIRVGGRAIRLEMLDALLLDPGDIPTLDFDHIVVVAELFAA